MSLHYCIDPDFEMCSLYQPSGLDKPDIKEKSQTHETAKRITSTETSQTITSGGTTVQGREGRKRHKAASQQHYHKNHLDGVLLQGGGGHRLDGEGRGPSPPVEGESSLALESEEQAAE